MLTLTLLKIFSFCGISSIFQNSCVGIKLIKPIEINCFKIFPLSNRRNHCCDPFFFCLIMLLPGRDCLINTFKRILKLHPKKCLYDNGILRWNTFWVSVWYWFPHITFFLHFSCVNIGEVSSVFGAIFNICCRTHVIYMLYAVHSNTSALNELLQT